MLQSEAGEIVMELELQWDGNPNIVLDIKTRVGVALPVQVIFQHNKILYVFLLRMTSIQIKILCHADCFDSWAEMKLCYTIVKIVVLIF